MVVLMYQRSFLKRQRKRLGGKSSNEVYLIEDKEPHRRFPSSRVATDEFFCIMTM
jgi:hypothetical protein